MTWLARGWSLPSSACRSRPVSGSPQAGSGHNQRAARCGSLPSRGPSRGPGLGRIDLGAQSRYAEDCYRFPPYRNAREHCLGIPDESGQLRKDSLRVACASERETLMGFVPGFTRPLLGRAARKLADSWLEDCSRLAAEGNSFHTLSTAVLVGQLLETAGFHGVMASPQNLQERFCAELRSLRLPGRERGYEQALAAELVVENPRLTLDTGFAALRYAEAEETLALDAEFADGSELRLPEASAIWAHGCPIEEQLVEHYVRRTHSRGTELRLDVGQIFRAKPVHRAGIDARHWRWKHTLGVKVKKASHINVLKLRAIGLNLRWRLRKRERVDPRWALRILHLSDSQVCLSILAKGRTGSKRLLPSLRRISARLIAGSLVLTVGFVSSERNPADEPSREP